MFKPFFSLKLSLKQQLVLLVVLVVSFFVLVSRQEHPDKKFQKQVRLFEKELNQQILTFEKQIQTVTAYKDSSYANMFELFQNISCKESCFFFVFDHDELKCWSTHQFIPDLSVNNKPKGIVKQSNGWYYFQKIKLAEEKYLVAYLLLQNNYSVHNNYLSSDLILNPILDVDILLEPTDKSCVKVECNQSVFYLKNRETSNKEAILGLVVSLCIFIGLFIVLESLIKHIQHQKTRQLFSVLFIVLVVLIKFFMTNNKIPSFWYSYTFFSPNTYASSNLLPSIGDFLLHALILFYIIRKTIAFTIQKATKKWFYILLSLSGIGLSLLSLLLKFGIEDLVSNSTINYDFSNLFDLNFYTLLGITCMGILVGSFSMVLFWMAKWVIKHNQILIGMGLFVFCGLITLFITSHSSLIVWYTVCPILVLFVCIVSVLRKNEGETNLTLLLLVISVLSMSTSFWVNKQVDNKEKEKRLLIIKNLGSERDPVAEFKFNALYHELTNNIQLQNLCKDTNLTDETLRQYIELNYLKGSWEQFDFNIISCRKVDSLNIETNKHNFVCWDYFNGKIKKSGDSTLSPNLWRIKDVPGRINYLGAIPIKTKDTIMLYFDFSSKFVTEQTGYPEILVDKEYLIKIDFSKYSLARYLNGNLFNSIGDNTYPMVEKMTDIKNETSKEVIINNYSHLFYRTSDGELLILSRKKADLLTQLSNISYFILIWGVFLGLYRFVVSVRKNKKRLFTSIKYRLQLWLISVILLAFISIGITTVRYFYTQLDKQNKENILERSKSVLSEMEHRIGESDVLSSNMTEYIDYLLHKFSNVFITDINLYNLEGDLIASSRKEVFTNQLLSRKMNPNAFNTLKNKNLGVFVCEEKIGKMKYLSAYILFRNNQDKPLAYLNLPYFSKHAKVTNELSSLLITVVNIFVVLTFLSLVVVILITDRITNSLKIIGQSMRQVELGKINQKIKWNHQDEIGSLVQEYNRMVEELYKSAELLAKSERESAWREMAKQVAHEIKNPLTPMKLSTQYLPLSLNNQDPQWQEKLNQYCQTMVNQIDTLSSIASAFSDFAKMPTAEMTIVNLSQLLFNTIDLYRVEGISFEYKTPTQPIFVKGDSKQLVQVFNNLVKNSIQALEEKKHHQAHLIISVTENEEWVTVTIEDNGIGISEEMKPKIFTPNFTTKNNGMGLGLAMVKNMIETCGGKIDFISKMNVGTQFIITFPSVKKTTVL